MTPHQKFQTIFEKWFRFTSVSIGYNILDKDFQFTPLTGITVTLVTSVLVFCLYTMFAFDSETGWKGASFVSLALQVRFYNLILKVAV